MPSPLASSCFAAGLVLAVAGLVLVPIILAGVGLVFELLMALSDGITGP